MLEEKGKFVHKFISKTQEKETGREEEGRRDGEEERKIGRERERGETDEKNKIWHNLEHFVATYRR